MQTHIAHLNFAKGFRGGERQTQLLIEELSKHNFKQKLLVRKNSQLTKRCKNIKNLEIIEISKPYIFHIAKIKDVTIFHAHETKALQFAFFANLITHIPYIVTRRVDNTIKNNYLNTLMYKSAKKAVALSHTIEDGILQISSDAKTTIIPSAFSHTQTDPREVQKIKQRFDGKFLIGHIGALDEKHKGQSSIINLAKKFSLTHKDIVFILIGGGKDEQLLKEMAHDLDNITFEGFVNNVPDYIAALDMFIFPSRNEGLGSTLLDVLYGEVAIIASNVGGIPDIIQNDVNGILFNLQKDNLEKIVLELYKNKEKREKLTKNGKNSIEKFSVANMTQAYIKLYTED